MALIILWNTLKKLEEKGLIEVSNSLGTEISTSQEVIHYRLTEIGISEVIKIKEEKLQQRYQ